MHILAQPGLLVPFIVFALVTSYTPGPNNSLLMASGLNFGFRRTLPTVLGVLVGFNLLILCVCLGLGMVFQAYPLAYAILKYAGAFYMLYLAWKIATADYTNNKTAGRARPFTFIEGAAIQVLNAKAWVMAVSAASTYAGLAAYPLNAFLIAGTFLFIGVGSASSWAAFGAALQRLLHKPKLIRAINIALAILLAASILPVLFE